MTIRFCNGKYARTVSVPWHCFNFLCYIGSLLLPSYTRNTITEASWLAGTTKEMSGYSSSSSFGSFIMIFAHTRTRYIQLVIENKDTQLTDYTEYDRVKILLHNWM